MEDVTLEFKKDALNEIAKRAIERKTGARGLRSILEGLLLDCMFEIPGMDDVEKVVVSAKNVTDGTKPEYVKAKKKKASKKSSAKSDKKTDGDDDTKEVAAS